MITTIQLLSVAITNGQIDEGLILYIKTYEYEHRQCIQMFKEPSHDQDKHEIGDCWFIDQTLILKGSRGNAINQLSNCKVVSPKKKFRTWFWNNKGLVTFKMPTSLGHSILLGQINT